MSEAKDISIGLKINSVKFGLYVPNKLCQENMPYDYVTMKLFSCLMIM